MTSLNLPGFSLTLLLLPREPVEKSGFESSINFNKELILECLDEPTEAPGWRWMYKGKPEMRVEKDEDGKKEKKNPELGESDVKGPKRERTFFLVQMTDEIAE